MSEYLPVLIMFVVAMGMAAVIPVLSWILGPQKPTRSKLSVYECGLRPVGNARERFSVKFYLIAILFIVFDIEVVFLYPWALSYYESFQDKTLVAQGMPEYLFWIMIVFFFELALGLLFAWRKGALDWSLPKEVKHGV